MPDNAVSITVNMLSAAHKRSLQALKRPVMDAARQFGAVREKLSDLAPKVVKLYTAIQADNERFSFVEFVRLFDATVPTHAADRDGTSGYRNHRTYYTLQYMRRIVQLGAGNRQRGQQGVRDSATDALARTLATVLQIVAEPENVWTAIQQEFNFSERLMTRLRKRVDATKPLIVLKTARPAQVGNVIHMDRATAQEPEGENAEPMRQRGRNIELPAATPARKRARAA